MAASLLAATIALWWGGWWGVVAGVSTGVAILAAISRMPSAAAVRLHERALADAPVVAAAAAATAAAGGDDLAVAEVTATVASPEVAAHLRSAAAAMRAGESPSLVWSALGRKLPALDSVADLLAHAADRGVAVVPALQASSAMLAAHTRRMRAAKARKAGVRALIPLGLLGMPGFMALTVVPLVAAYASSLSLW
jgi:hypothetical protein